MNVGESLFFEQSPEKKRGFGGLLPEKSLEATPLKASENSPFNPLTELQIVFQFRAFSDTKPFIIGGNRPLAPLSTPLCLSVC